ncbi:MAM and LDL-receptor class A domain-containing protein 2-like isoform X2 [Patella vulgata]|uniref:MAM and LDL-receptor class A domain-containing protein 2-like isoform X2 n=1 Tax=Patella vulgata TaxID=6465 RepID=UPI00217F8C7C|nr:MAM and LDL-receptor class A domain-containing protein 2-like isoform X2 [Patella vulgata]
MIGSRLYTTLWITIFAGLVSSQSCDFESDFCGWTNEASAIWERLNTATETTSTGPDRGHTTNTTTINRLSMGILNDSKKQQMFIKTGDQNNSWHCGSFDVQTTVNTKIYIEAVTGENIFGDIAIDDLEIIQGKCNSSCGTISPDSPTTLPSNIITNSTSPVRSSPTTQPGNPGTTKETFNPVTDNILIYATCIPIAVLILIGVVAFICYKNKKKPEIFQPPRYGRRISNIQYQSYDRPVEEEETYDYIDDNQMRENQTDLGNPDYQTLPEDGGYILPPPPPPPPPCGPTTYIQAINGSDDPDDSVRF